MVGAKGPTFTPRRRSKRPPATRPKAARKRGRPRRDLVADYDRDQGAYVAHGGPVNVRRPLGRIVFDDEGGTE